ncbi:MAG: hypothetical protein Q7S33_02410 [Nanoarchaeota archaeon]|nr:hypothetical protein [Nanoarchaeota archaeon]
MWILLEWCLVITVAVFIISQIILPPFINKRFFWILRKKEKKLDAVGNELIDAQVDLEVAETRAAVKKVLDKTSKLNHK